MKNTNQVQKREAQYEFKNLRKWYLFLIIWKEKLTLGGGCLKSIDYSIKCDLDSKSNRPYHSNKSNTHLQLRRHFRHQYSFPWASTSRVSVQTRTSARLPVRTRKVPGNFWSKCHYRMWWDWPEGVSHLQRCFDFLHFILGFKISGWKSAIKFMIILHQSVLLNAFFCAAVPQLLFVHAALPHKSPSLRQSRIIIKMFWCSYKSINKF